MESKRGHDKLTNGYGISKGKSNLAAGSFGLGMRWTSMFWKEKFNSQQREFENTISTIKSFLIDRANHEF